MSTAARRKVPFRVTSSPIKASPARSIGSLPDMSDITDFFTSDLQSDVVMQDFKLEDRLDEGMPMSNTNLGQLLFFK